MPDPSKATTGIPNQPRADSKVFEAGFAKFDAAIQDDPSSKQKVGGFFAHKKGSIPIVDHTAR